MGVGVTVTLNCGGCFVSVEGTRPLEEKFQGRCGKDWQIGNWVRTPIEEVAPEGWVPFDPYTKCCYCPKCWAEITGGKEL